MDVFYKEIFKKAALLLLCNCFFLLPVYCQPGKLDNSFNVSDNGNFGDGAYSVISAVAKTSAGKIIIGGDHAYFNGDYFHAYLTWLNSDGSIDNNTSAVRGPNGRVRFIAPQANGKIYIAGDFNRYDGYDANRIARINENGTFDNTFNTGTGASNIVYCLAVQVDGKVIIGGNFSTINGSASRYIGRFNTDGSLDTSFHVGTGASGQVLGIGLQAGGKIIITGTFTSYNGTACNRIARLNSDGSFDNTFNMGTGLNNPGTSIQMTTAGKIYVGGLFATYNDNAANRLVRLNSDGTYDNGFNSTVGGVGNVETIHLQADGKLLAGGDLVSYNGTIINRMVRVNADGSLDASFNIGAGANNTVRAFLALPDGKIITAGSFTLFNKRARNYYAGLLSNGTVDAGFAPIPGVSGVVNRLRVLPNNKILIGGKFLSVNDTYRQKMARVNEDGTVDLGFDADTAAVRDVNDFAVQSTGKIVFAMPYSLPGPLQSCLLRLNADGTIDNSFNTGYVNFSGSISKVIVLPDDKIIIAGDFQTFSSAASTTLTRSRLARLNADGTIDPTFDMGTMSPNNGVFSIAVQADGKILISGAFTNLIGTARLVRINTNGKVDSSFNIGTGFSGSPFLYALLPMPDGKILVGGSFTSYNSQSVKYLIRLEGNGSLDTSFAADTTFNNTIVNLLVLPDNKLIATGTFSRYNTTNIERLARLNADYSLDTCFNPGTATTYSISTIGYQAPGKIIIGGNFIDYNGTRKNRLARIDAGSCTTAITFNWTGNVSTAWETSGNWSGNTVPSSASAVFIPSGRSRYPVVSVSTTVKSIGCAQGTSVIVNTGVVLNILR